MGPHLLLAGGGHAHLFVLEGLARGRFPPGLAVTLVTEARHHAYSGMVPGFLGGRYRAEELVLDLGAITQAARAELIERAVTGLDTAARTVTLADGRSLSYDLLSLAIGSRNAGADLPGVDAAVLLKPIDRALRLPDEVSRAVSASSSRSPRSVVVGAGAAGIELALNLRARLRLLGRPDAPVTVIDDGDRILRDRSDACRRAAARALMTQRIEVDSGSGVTRLVGEQVVLNDGRVLGADLVVWATGPAAPPLFRDTGLALDDQGYVRVDASLRSVSHPEIFAAGDGAALEGYPDLPKSGVYAVRQGPVLRENLASAASGRPANRQYHPQRRFLALLNTGDGRAICSYGELAVTARWAMVLKDRIDRRFMRRFQRLVS